MDLLNWQQIDQFSNVAGGAAEKRTTQVITYRAAVPGGWLVAMFKWDRETRAPKGGEVDVDIANSVGLTFVADPGHNWNTMVRPG